VCERHVARSWDGPNDACGCGAAGAPWGRCNQPAEGEAPRVPEGFKTEVEAACGHWKLSDHLNPNLKPGQIIVRIIFSLCATAAVGIGAYFAIKWLAHFH
jgi:hypothetical protein